MRCAFERNPVPMKGNLNRFEVANSIFTAGSRRRTILAVRSALTKFPSFRYGQYYDYHQRMYL